MQYIAAYIQLRTAYYIYIYIPEMMKYNNIIMYAHKRVRLCLYSIHAVELLLMDKLVQEVLSAI